MNAPNLTTKVVPALVTSVAGAKGEYNTRPDCVGIRTQCRNFALKAATGNNRKSRQKRLPEVSVSGIVYYR